MKRRIRSVLLKIEWILSFPRLKKKRSKLSNHWIFWTSMSVREKPLFISKKTKMDKIQNSRLQKVYPDFCVIILCSDVPSVWGNARLENKYNKKKKNVFKTFREKKKFMLCE